MRGRLRWLALAALVTLASILLVIWPLAELLVVAAQGRFGAGFDGAARAAGNTLLVGLAVASITVTLGVAAAFLTERTSIAGRGWLRLGILIPALIPPFVSALSWMRAYGPSGLFDDMTGLSLPGLFGPLGVILVISVNAVPLAYLLTVAALNSRIDHELELAARISGGRSATVARTITFPLLAPALGGAGALVFVFAINSFGVPAFLGTPASFETVTTLIYQDLALSARPESFDRALLLATALVATAFVLVLVAETLLGGLGQERKTTSSRGPGRRTGPGGRTLMIVGWLAVAMTTVIPLLALILVAMTKGVGLAPVPANWTMGNFAEALGDRFLGALGRSFLLGVAAATCGVLLGSAVAAFRRRRFGRFTGVIVLASFAVPGSTLAVAVILSYGSWLRDTLFIILIAYVAKLWAVGHRAVAGSAANIPPELSWAARSSGAGPLAVMRTVVVPMLRPAIVAGWILVFLLSFHELTMSSLLYGPGTDTLAVSILNLQQLGDVPVSSALAVILTVPLLIAAMPILATGRLPRRLLGTE